MSYGPQAYVGEPFQGSLLLQRQKTLAHVNNQAYLHNISRVILIVGRYKAKLELILVLESEYVRE
jgi:hypothetical protein